MHYTRNFVSIIFNALILSCIINFQFTKAFPCTTPNYISQTITLKTQQQVFNYDRISLLSKKNQFNYIINNKPQNFLELKALSDDTTSEENNNNSMTTPLNRPILAIIDFFVFILFASIGKVSHTSASDNILQDIQLILITAAPFIISWYATSPFTGVYNTLSTSIDNSNNNIRKTFIQTVKGWIIAMPLGCALRGIIRGYAPPIPFVIVTLITTLILLSIARILYTIIDNKLKIKTL